MFGKGRGEINSCVVGWKMMGYGGKVGVKIVMRNGVVEKMIGLKNDERKELFENGCSVFEKW